MDGYTLIARMRKTRRRFRLTATEQALYQELVSICNEEGWSDIFHVSNSELFSALSITEKTLIKARETLIKSGLLFYFSGQNKRSVGSYSFLQAFESAGNFPVNNTDNMTAQSIGDITGNNSDFIKTKTKTENNNDNFLKKKGGKSVRELELEKIYRKEIGR